MQLPSILRGESLTRLLQGAAAGVVATMIIGFNWGGWTLGSTAEKQVKDAEQASIVRVLAPICADKFQHAADVGEILGLFDSESRRFRGGRFEANTLAIRCEVLRYHV